VGAFSQLANAESLVKVLNSKGIPARMTGGGSTTTTYSSTNRYLVQSTVVDSKAKAQQLVSTFTKSGHPSMLVESGAGKYSVQLGAFSSRNRAQALATELKQKGMFVSINASAQPKLQRRSTGGLCKAFAGSYPTEQAARQAMHQLRSQNIPAVVARQ
jgi:cell division septation protein DedD